MRTTVDIEDDVLDILRSLSRAQGRPLGAVVSELVRRAVAPVSVVDDGPGGFPAFESPAGARALTVETVRAALDDEA